jgi:hypothetical protein
MASNLTEHGYEVIPVNPALAQELGREAHGSLREVAGRIDGVDGFRRSDAVPAIAREAVEVGAKVL